MPTKDFRAFYRGLDGALDDLYRPDVLTLAAADNGAMPAFDRKVFDRAGEWIRKEGKFTPSMLKEKPAQDLINEVFRVLQNAITDNVSIEMPDDLVGLMENNAFEFSGLKSFHSLSEVGLSLFGENGEIKPFETFRQDVAKIDDKYNRNYLNAEYNHAVTTAQAASKWRDIEADGDRYDLQYRTAGDSLVREEHAKLDGITLPPSDPFWAQYMPPNGWNCRCTVVQVLKGRYPASDSAEAVKLGDEATADPKQKIFRSNPGKDMKIFPDKHPYDKAPKQAKEAIADLARQRDAGLRRQTETAVKEWFRGNVKGTIKSNALDTGEMKLTNDSIKRYLGHARDTEEKWMLKNVAEHPKTLKHIGYSPLGATKNMDNPAHRKNVDAKKKRHVIGYNLYKFEYRGQTWIIGFEKIKQGDNSFEQPYYIKKKKS